jgi:hypothetical protein
MKNKILVNGKVHTQSNDTVVIGKAFANLAENFAGTLEKINLGETSKHTLEMQIEGSFACVTIETGVL